MLENTAAMSARSRADRPPAKARSRPERARYNGRSREARCVRRLVNELKTAFGDARINPMMSAAIQRAAELGVIAADLRARRIRGEAVDIGELVKAENAAQRAIAALGLDRKRAPAGPSLAEYLAARNAELEDASADKSAELTAEETDDTVEPPGASKATPPVRLRGERMKPAITLSHALTDPGLFGPVFAASSFWTWKVVAKLIDGEPLTEPRDLALFKEATGRSQPPNRQTRRALRRLILLCGRRAGKDRFLSAVAVWRAALAADWRTHISAGEQAVVLLLGADRRQAAILRRYCEGLLQAPLLAAEVKRRTDDTIEFRNGGALEIGTNDVRLIRGRSAVAVLGSETCYWRTDEHAASSDEEVVGAAEPSLAMCPDGGLLLLGSSVYRKRGYMYRQFRRLHSNDAAEDICWFAPSRTMNPKLPEAIVEAALANDAPKGRAEFLNFWREDVDDFVPIDIVAACTDWGVIERPPRRGIRYTAFADAAGGTGQDFSRWRSCTSKTTLRDLS